MEQLTFVVPTKGLCIMCLTDSTSTKMETLSVKSLHSFLNLNYRKIFNITNPKIFREDECEKDGAGVDINIVLCRSCADIRNKFCDLYEEMDTIQNRLNSCVQTMLEVMINAESNVIRSRNYQQRITGMKEKSLTAASARELIKESIPDRFRKETMQKCVFQVEKSKVKHKVSPKMKSEMDSTLCQEDLGFVPPTVDDCNNGEDFAGQTFADNTFEDEVSDEDEMKVDEDADPEELMMKYNCDPNGFKYNGKNESKFEYSGETLWDDVEGLELDEQELDNGSDALTTFNSKYQCQICNKVVVSLKNFELHQRRHTGEKPFACPFCEQHFRDTSNLRSHALRYHRQFLFANFKDTALSDDQFKNALDKIVQCLVQVNEGVGLSHQSHRCNLCNKNYTQKYAIEDHIVQRHYDVLSTAILHLQKDVLGYESQDIAQYILQILQSGETCTVCGLCGQQFETGLEVNSHMKVHVKVKVARGHAQGSVQKADTSDSLIQLKMKCNFCSKYFEDLHALTKHKTLHQGNCASAASRESIFNCEHCGRSFCSFYSQRSHVLTFHRYQVFSKYLPDGTTANEIETMVKGITGKYTKLPNGLFQCSLCKKEITQLRKLQSHMLVTHFDEVVIKLKVAVHQLRLKNGEHSRSNSSELQHPELDYYENSNGSIPMDDEYGDYDYEGENNTAVVLFNDGEDASDSLEVLISHPD